MKKHDEGYALLLVVVTLLVLAIMSAALMSMGVRNLKNQKASLEQMVDKYDAQGEVEKVVAKLSQNTTLDKDSINTFEEKLTEWVEGAGDVEWSSALTLTPETDSTESTEPTDPTGATDPTQPEEEIIKGTYSGVLTLTVPKESVKIQCELIISGSYEEKTSGLLAEDNVYEITPNEVVYGQYVISHTSEGGAGG